MVQETIGSYQQVNLERQNLDMSFKGWNYALLPAWILTYLYKGKTYVYAVNGQNGKAHGELPVDNKKAEPDLRAGRRRPVRAGDHRRAADMVS